MNRKKIRFWRINKIQLKFISIILFISVSYFAKTFIITLTNIPNIEKIDVNKFLNLIDKPISPNHPLILKEKQNLLNLLSNYSGHVIKNVNTIFYSPNNRFGNQLIIISKIIFFCEILGCKRIILNRKNNWFIKNKIDYAKYNMTIETGIKSDCKKKKTIFDISINWFYYYSFIKPELKINVIKNEILSNIPKITTNPNDLYIHIRSGDIFENNNLCNEYYSQPPLCFYQTIISNNKFRKIYIISEDTKNPVINKLIQSNPSILYNKNDIKMDISYLVYAYQIIGSFSTFLNIIIRMNDNLKYLWEYNLPSMKSKIIHCHHSCIKPFKNIIYYIMEPSDNYKKVMTRWNCSKVQLALMINEKCNNTFIISKK